jgi:hypothetical protein
MPGAGAVHHIKLGMPAGTAVPLCHFRGFRAPPNAGMFRYQKHVAPALAGPGGSRDATHSFTALAKLVLALRLSDLRLGHPAVNSETTQIGPFLIHVMRHDGVAQRVGHVRQLAGSAVARTSPLLVTGYFVNRAEAQHAPDLDDALQNLIGDSNASHTCRT